MHNTTESSLVVNLTDLMQMEQQRVAEEEAALRRAREEAEQQARKEAARAAEAERQRRAEQQEERSRKARAQHAESRRRALEHEASMLRARLHAEAAIDARKQASEDAHTRALHRIALDRRWDRRVGWLAALLLLSWMTAAGLYTFALHPTMQQADERIATLVRDVERATQETRRLKARLNQIPSAPVPTAEEIARPVAEHPAQVKPRARPGRRRGKTTNRAAHGNVGSGSVDLEGVNLESSDPLEGIDAPFRTRQKSRKPDR